MNALNHCSYSALVSWATFFPPKFWTVTTVPSGTVATIAIVFFFFSYNQFVLFFFLLNIYVSRYIYCYIDTTNFTIFLQLLTCTNALKHCSYKNLVSWATFFFPQVLNSNYSAKWHCSYDSYSFFFLFFPYNQFVFFFNIYVSWYIYCYIDTTNFTVFSQLLTCVNALKRECAKSL